MRTVVLRLMFRLCPHVKAGSICRRFVTIGNCVTMPEMLQKVKDGDLRKAHICPCRTFPIWGEGSGVEGPVRKELRNVCCDTPAICGRGVSEFCGFLSFSFYLHHRFVIVDAMIISPSASSSSYTLLLLPQDYHCHHFRIYLHHYLYLYLSLSPPPPNPRPHPHQHTPPPPPLLPPFTTVITLPLPTLPPIFPCLPPHTHTPLPSPSLHCLHHQYKH